MEPGSPLFQLVVADLQAGRFEAASRRCASAIEVDKQDAWAHAFYGLAHHHLEDHATAITHLRIAAQIRPNETGFLNNLALVYTADDQLDLAVDCFQKLIAKEPASSVARNNLGQLYEKTGQLQIARTEYELASKLEPRNGTIALNLARVLRLLEEPAKAEALLMTSKALISTAAAGHYWAELTVVRQLLGKLTDSYVAARASVKASPLSPEYRVNLSTIALTSDFLDEALREANQAVAIDLSYTPALIAGGNALLRTGDPAAAARSYQNAINLNPKHQIAQSNRLFALWHDPTLSPQQVFNAHADWGRQAGTVAQAPIAPLREVSTADRPLRVGYVSPDLRAHPVGAFMKPIFAAHDRKDVEIICYSTAAMSDVFSDVLRAAALQGPSDRWRDVAPLSDERLAAVIREDRIDVLVDLSCHGANNRQQLFLARPAPVQVSYLGYPATTGSLAMDVKYTDASIDPVGATFGDDAASLNVERLFRLPSYFVYDPQPNWPEVTDRNGVDKAVTFASTSTLAKLNDQVLKVWARLLQATPGATLMIFVNALQSPSVGQRFERIFRSVGVDPGRCKCVPTTVFRNYLESHKDFDVILDPFPFSGGTTTCHALWMGVPVVTLGGVAGVARTSASLLGHVDLHDLVATSEDHYIEIASRLAGDADRRQALRHSLRDRLAQSAVMNVTATTRAIETGYRENYRAALLNHIR